jgi:hypothetical protein
MISIAEARKLDSAQLTETERSFLVVIFRKVDETLRAEFDGLGVYLTVPAEQATARVMADVCARIRDEGWYVQLYFNFVQRPSMVGGPPQNKLLSYTVIVAVDAISENILRVRRETANQL